MAQQNEVDFENPSSLKMKTEYSSNNEEIRDILSFEGIDYMKINFTGKDLKGKGYHLKVKEIWDGEIVSDTTVLDSRQLGIKQFETLDDSIFGFKVISKKTNQNKLKMTFVFPRFRVTKEYDAINGDDYSLRNLADESSLQIGYGKPFYLLAYILPYEREDGSKSWCDVGTSGSSVEEWGAEFGIKHYLIFELSFD